MTCFNCGYRLPDDHSKECSLCGMKMPLVCHSCKSANPRHGKFCLSCGSSLNQKDQENPSPFEQSLPKNLDEGRRTVAVIFADVSGFTALAEKLDPEDVRNIINDCFQTITKPVYELEGSIDKYIGDCVMVLFGAQKTHADDAYRAVSCALKMQAFMETFSTERLSGRGLQLRLSIGVHYGLVVTGSVGNYYDKDYTVMGDTVNLAQRLQTTAAAGTILVSQSVYEETHDLFYYKDQGTIFVKNRKESVRSYQPEYEILLTRNRNHLFFERDEIQDCIPNILQTYKNSTTICLINGETGVGKTTVSQVLVQKMQEKLQSSMKTIQLECSSTDYGRPHSLLSSLLHIMMNIEADTSITAKRYRTVSYCFYLFPHIQEAVVERMSDFLGIFMGLERKPDFQDILDHMNPQDLEREMIEQLVGFFENVLILRPTLLVLDGLQWSDDRSLVLLKQVLKKLSGNSSIWLLSSRPDTRLEFSEFSWINDSNAKNHTQPALWIYHWMLQPLSKKSTIQMATQLLSCTRISNDYHQRLMDITQGNPLYIHEFLQAAKRKNGVLIVDGEARFTAFEKQDFLRGIQGIILANFQSMPPRTLAILQAASVIGSSFHAKWLQDILGISDAKEILEPAIKAGMLDIQGTLNSGAFLQREIHFSHDLAREVLYDSLLHARRTELHGKLAAYFERLNQKDDPVVFGLISEQYEKAGNIGKSARFLIEAAGKSMLSYDFNTAYNQWIYFLKMLGFHLPDNLQNADPELSINENQQGWADQKKIQVLMGIDGPSLVLMALLALAKIDRLEGRGKKSVLFLKQALYWADSMKERLEIRLTAADVMRESGYYEPAMDELNSLENHVEDDDALYGHLLLTRCTIQRLKTVSTALDTAKKAEIRLKKAKDYLNLTETMNQMAGIFFSQGQPSRAKLALSRAQKYAERSHDIGSLARISGNLGVLYLAEGDTASARASFTTAVEMAGKISNLHSLLSSQINLGILYMEQGRYTAAENLLSDVVERSVKSMFQYQTCLAYLNLADLSVERGQSETALARYAEAEKLADSLSLSCEKALCMVGRAHLMINVAEITTPHFLKAADQLLIEALPLLEEADESTGTSICFRLQSEIMIKSHLLALYASSPESNPSLSLSIVPSFESNMPPGSSETMQKALALAEQAYQTAAEAANGIGQVKALRLLGIIYTITGNMTLALQQTSASVKEAERIDSDIETAKSAYQLSELYTKTGEIKKAKEWEKWTKEHMEMVDSCSWKEGIA